MVASLIGLTLLVSAMAGARFAYSGNTEDKAILWNLFLAWIPCLLAVVVYYGLRRGAPVALLTAGGLVWLLFFPNAPYLITDLKTSLT